MTARPPTLQIEVRTSLNTATVEAVATEDDARVTVKLPSGTAPAQLAVTGDYEPAVGDTVLVASGTDDQCYVIGVLRARATPVRALAASDGALATLEGAPGAEVLRVRDGAGRLLLEHRAGDRTTVLHAEGDLEFRADHGSIRMVARDQVEVQAAGARVKVKDAELEATTVRSVAERVVQIAGVLETRAGRILERAKNVYRDVEELSQTRAGRIKLVAAKTFHLLGQRALFKAKEDVKIKGEKIYLA